MAEEFIPIFMFAAVTVILWKFFETRHKERMAIIDKSLDPLVYKELFSSQMARITPLSNLKWGLIFLFVGVGIMCGMQFRAMYGTSDFIPAFIFLGGGIALVLFYFIAARKSAAGKQ
jgi:hypothetical protein